MKMNTRISTAIAGLLCAAFAADSAAMAAPAAGSALKIDSATSTVSAAATFHAKPRATALFSGVSGTVIYDAKDFTKAKVEASVPLGTINTKLPKRDDDLKGAKYFNIVKFPAATFKSKKIAKAAKGKYNMVGDLSLHGISKQVTVVVDQPAEKTVAGAKRFSATGTTTIDQKDFGLATGPLMPDGRSVCDDKLDLTLNIEAVEPAAAGTVKGKPAGK